ncbi:MAG: DegT/DnrJ/EryC1/StrS family aminotransferase [Pyrinomonadaceae bacterium]
MNVPLMDMVAQYRGIEAEVDAAIKGVLEAGHFILGPNVAALEREVAAYLGTGHAVGVASGTDALVLALRALDVGPGDEVIVPAYTFFATAEAVMMVGATPVFVDVEADTYCLDVRQVADQITPRTKAVIPVHLYGHPVDMSPLLELAQDYGLRVVEDNAQAFGAEYDGQKTGALGDVGCLSFFPSKNLGGCGDGGMVVTNDPAVAERVRMLRTHGWRRKYHPEMVGYNSRLDELQAAILRVKLRHVDAWNDLRRRRANYYADALLGTGVEVPYEAAYARHVYHLYMIRVSEREAFERSLRGRGVASALYYPLPLHLLEPCREFGYREGDFPRAEQASRETLAVPLYPEMTEAQADEVVKALVEAALGAAVASEITTGVTA